MFLNSRKERKEEKQELFLFSFLIDKNNMAETNITLFKYTAPMGNDGTPMLYPREEVCARLLNPTITFEDST